MVSFSLDSIVTESVIKFSFCWQDFSFYMRDAELTFMSLILINVSLTSLHDLSASSKVDVSLLSFLLKNDLLLCSLASKEY